MGKRGLGAGLAASALQDQDGLGLRGAAGRAHELARVAEALHVEQDHMGLGVASEMIQQVADIDIQGVAQGHHVGESQPVGRGPVEGGRGHGAGLRDQGDGAGRRHRPGETRVDPRGWRQHAEAVRTDDAQEVRTRGVQDRLPPDNARFVVAFEAGADDHRRAATAPPKLGDQPRHGRCGCGDDGQVRCLRQVRHRGGCGPPVHGAARGVGEHQASLEPAGEQVGGQDVADR